MKAIETGAAPPWVKADDPAQAVEPIAPSASRTFIATFGARRNCAEGRSGRIHHATVGASEDGMRNIHGHVFIPSVPWHRHGQPCSLASCPRQAWPWVYRARFDIDSARSPLDQPPDTWPSRQTRSPTSALMAPGRFLYGEPCRKEGRVLAGHTHRRTRGDHPQKVSSPWPYASHSSDNSLNWLAVERQ